MSIAHALLPVMSGSIIYLLHLNHKKDNQLKEVSHFIRTTKTFRKYLYQQLSNRVAEDCTVVKINIDALKGGLAELDYAWPSYYEIMMLNEPDGYNNIFERK